MLVISSCLARKRLGGGCLGSLPDTYDGANCFQVLEVHHRWDTSREFGSDDVIPVLKPCFNPLLSD